MKLRIRDEGYTKTRPLLVQVQEILDGYDMAVTSRQIYYRLVALSVVSNTESAYKQVLRICVKGRYTGHLDWDSIVDDMREAYKTPDWKSIEEAVEGAIDNFRLDRWAASSDYLEVFVEKSGMINVLYPTTNKLDVHITACRGFNSTSNVYAAAVRLARKERQGKEITILYFGDFDPSGVTMHTDIEKRLREFGLNVHMKRVLLDFDHVQEHSLPISFEVLAKKADGIVYDKLKADPRSKRFLDEHGRLMQVEIDALDPKVLVGYVESAIKEYMDRSEFDEVMKREDEDRARMSEIIGDL